MSCDSVIHSHLGWKHDVAVAGTNVGKLWRAFTRFKPRVRTDFSLPRLCSRLRTRGN